MKKLTLLLAVCTLCAPHSYGMEAHEADASDKTVAHVVDAPTSDAQKGEPTIAELEKTLAQLKLSQKEKNIVRSWIGKHKTGIGIAAGALATYATFVALSRFVVGERYKMQSTKSATSSSLYYVSDGCVETDNFKYYLRCLNYLLIQLPIDWAGEQLTGHTARTAAILAATILFSCIALHEYSHGKDSTTAKIWNKFFGKKQGNTQTEKKVAAQSATVATPVAV
jgi:hypothetical protein